jgi:hypothetical protein
VAIAAAAVASRKVRRVSFELFIVGRILAGVELWWGWERAGTAKEDADSLRE